MCPTAVQHRRALHRIPELHDQLPQTLAYVSGVLEALDCQTFSPIPGSVCAWFDFGKQEAVAFRADMDALPLSEDTGLPYASCHPGVMHACGHDGHAAMLLELAQWLSERPASVRRNVLLLFQPAEETTGGAKRICETGVLSRFGVSRIFGLHLWPGVPKGTLASRPGALMARSNEVTVTLTGQSVHLSRLSEGRDALLAGAEFVRRVYDLAEKIPGRHVLRFGKMTSGSVRNAVSDRTCLEGSLRTWEEPVWKACRAALDRAAEEVREESGCGVEVHLNEGYFAVENDPALYAAVSSALGEDAPAEVREAAFAAEDFSFYQKAVPGVFFFLGVGETEPLHSPRFAFDDEAVLPRGAAFLKRLSALE